MNTVLGYVVVNSNARGGLVAIPVTPATVKADDRLIKVDAPSVPLGPGRTLPERTFTFPRHTCGRSWFITGEIDPEKAVARHFTDDNLSACERIRHGECPIEVADAIRRCRV